MKSGGINNLFKKKEPEVESASLSQLPPQSEPASDPNIESEAPAFDPKFDRAKGAIMGALCGDAIGAVLEFYFKKINDKVVTHAFSMPGGGAHNVGKGQITDDGELTMSLLHALCAGKGKVKKKEIARFYAQWIKSKPFDIGNTCRNSLFKANPKNPDPKLIQKAALKSEKSQSNGALMRITPMAVFCHRIEDFDSIAKAAGEDAKFTHCNETVILTNAIYCYIIVLLINLTPLEEVYSQTCEKIEESKNEDLQTWLEDSKKEEPPTVSKKAGWLRHAFVFCLRFLRLAQTEPEEEKDQEEDKEVDLYTKYISEVLKGGGDTDTNACIVGGVVGAMVGYKKLPEVPKKKVLSWPSKPGDGIKRDDFLKPSKFAEKLIKKLYEIAPETVEIE